MSTRTLVRLGTIAAGLLVLWLVLGVLPREGDGPTPDSAGRMGQLLSGLGGQAVHRITIEGPDGERVLQRNGDEWTIDRFSAEGQLVGQLISGLSTAPPPELVARNPDNHFQMGLVPDSAYLVSFETDDATERILVGHVVPSSSSTFVRLPDEDDTYLLDLDLRRLVARTVVDWRDRLMIDVDTARVRQVRVERADGSYTARRGDSAWTLDSGAPADSGLLRNILAGLAEIRATDFLEGTDRPDPLDPEIVVVAQDALGDTLIAVHLGDLGENWWARRTDSETVFVVPEFRMDQLAPTLYQVTGGS